MEFKPGTYKEGDIVTVNGVQYVADRDILFASALPRDNMYWTKVEATPPTPEPIPTTGLSPKNTPEQNSLAIESILAAIPEGGCKSIYIPAGNYNFARTINLYRRPVYLYGDNGTIWGNSTKLIFPPNTTGILIDRGGQSIQETIIERVCLIGGGGAIDGNGIRSNARIKLRDVTLKSFAHNGLLIIASMEEGGDASGSYIESCHALENGHDGFQAGKTDGNAITFINCDARDNKRVGFNDDSFLGNNFIGCMCHYNAVADYYVRDLGNARSAFIACYAESGGKPSRFGPHTTIVGGFLASGYTQN